MKPEKITLQNRKGQKIVGDLEFPLNNPIGTAVVQHGHGGFKEEKHIQVIKDAFLNNNFITFNFDSTNSFNESDGEYEKATLGLHYEDFEDVANWAQEQKWFKAPLAVSGHSLGGYSVARYAEENPDKVALCAPIAPLVSGELSWEAHEESDPEGFRKWETDGIQEIQSSSEPNKIRRTPWSYTIEKLSHDLLPNADKLTMPIFLYVGTKDKRTPKKHIKKLFDVIPEGNKTLVIAEGAPHTYRTEADLKHLSDNLNKWLKTLN